ncbi:MAG: alanine:cation symporter family protein [Lentisphaerae bacterium]|nr:alanine:cation symporter family protein [Lentisphaerota bacterium]
MEELNLIWTSIYAFLLDLTNWPLAFVLLAGGIYFTIRTFAVQVRLFPEAWRVIIEKPKTPGSVSSFGALMVSTASRVGTGNIIGVSVAICAGGPGAVFWMWITAVIGGAAAFVESTLAQIYKRRNPDNSSYGGPSCYIESACKSKFLAVVFAIALIFTYGVGYNMLASYNLQSSFAAFNFYGATPYTCWIIGGIIALLFLVSCMGGSNGLVKVTGALVPFMGAIYIIFALIALGINIKNIPEMFVAIFSNAFSYKAVFGGMAGSVLLLGLKRGLYSNEAGIGSAPNAAAAADVSHPAKQGLVQMLSVFLDTNIICTATALMCLSSGIGIDADAAGAPYVQQSLQATFGIAGPVFIAVAMSLFAFTTLLGNFYYVENCFAYIFGHRPGKLVLTVIRVIGALLIFAGAGMQMAHAWNLADIAQCILAFINIPVCVIIGGIAYKALKNYVQQRKQGIEPVYIARENGVKAPTDFWN